METGIFLGDNPSQISSYHIFHEPWDRVFHAFTNIEIMQGVYNSQTKWENVKFPTSIDEEGNELTFSMRAKDGKTHIFTFRSERPVHSKLCYSFKLKTIYYPCEFCPFVINYQFYWDTISEVSIFHQDIAVEDSNNKEKLLSFLKESDIFPVKKIEKYFWKTINNLEEVESIIIKANISAVWGFVKWIENLKFFIPIKNIEIKVDKEEGIVRIIDAINKNEIKLKRLERVEDSGYWQELELKLFESILPMPKQLIIISLVKLKEKLTWIRFKHIILEYIPYDVWRSNNPEKQKILRKIKKIIEDFGTNINATLNTNDDSINKDNPDNSESSIKSNT